MSDQNENIELFQSMISDEAVGAIAMTEPGAEVRACVSGRCR
jgi:hypothetical protein